MRVGHELCRNDIGITGAQMLDQGKGAAMAEQYVAGQVNQVDFDNCIEPSQGMASRVDQSSLSGWSSSSRGESEFGNSQGSSSMPSKGLPHFVVEALWQLLISKVVKAPHHVAVQVVCNNNWRICSPGKVLSKGI